MTITIHTSSYAVMSLFSDISAVSEASCHFTIREANATKQRRGETAVPVREFAVYRLFRTARVLGGTVSNNRPNGSFVPTSIVTDTGGSRGGGQPGHASPQAREGGIISFAPPKLPKNFFESEFGSIPKIVG